MSVGGFALRHGRALGFFAVLLALGGILAAAAMPKGIYPEVSFPREQVVGTLAGAPVETVLVGLTRPLEEAVAGVPGLQRVRSRTIRGAAELSLYFAPDTDMAAAHPQVLARLAGAHSALGAGAEVTAQRVLPSGFPILSLNVSGPQPASELFLIAQYTLRPALSGLPGVGLVTVQSSDIPEFQVLLSPARLEGAHLTVPQVAERLRLANDIQAVARLTDAHELALAVVSGAVLTPEQIAGLVVGGTPVAPVRIADLGRVVESTEPTPTVIRVDGHPGVIVNVGRRPGGDALTLNAAARNRLAELAPSLPPGVKVEPVYEQARFVSDAVSGVRDAVLFGAGFAVLVLALFLRDWRATAVAAAALPLTLGATLVVLDALGQTLDLMSLGGLAVAVGLVIDDAVVVVEAVHRHLEEGAAPAEAARAGTDELFGPVLGTTLTTVVVFAPLAFLSGVAGQFFRALSLSLATAVLISMPVALLVLPALASRFLRPVRRGTPGKALAARYAQLQQTAFSRRSWILRGAAAVVVLGGLLALRLPSDFLPEADEGAYVVDFFAPVAASRFEADRLVRAVEDLLQKTP
ncbi:MAG TPA: efflux RND transporter permease subunit, partial [Myxococcaceae bacterium]